ncbi:MAG: xanthine dehydrogenase family protein subunit M, partial [Nonomuraea sp.]|nr:xanthine dehydrogenase family protein subunit M [Nonomuraea sp.]
HLLSGGTDLLVQRRAGRRQGALADISGLRDAPAPVTVSEKTITLSALAPLTVLATELTRAREQNGLTGPTNARELNGLVEAISCFASGQIRNRATLGGNLANASPAADCVPPLVAAGAVARLRGPDGRRDLPVEDLATGPGRTALRPGEWIEAIDVPRTPATTSGFRKIAGRQALAISVVSLAWQWTADSEGNLSGVRLSAGAVAPTVIRCRTAEQALEGRVPTPDLARAIQHDIAPIDDLRAGADYRRRALEGALVEALMRRNQ